MSTQKTTHPSPSPAASVLAELEVVLTAARVRTTLHAAPAEETRARALAMLRDKLSVASNSQPLLVLIAGGTNVGKSTVCNALVRDDVSVVSPLARGTKSPVVCGAEPAVVPETLLLPGVRTLRAEGAAGSTQFDEPTVVRAVTGFPPEGCLLIDSPDMDSDHAPNRSWAERLLRAADAVVLVTTPEKYHDAAVGDFLRQAAALARSLAAVMNKSDSTAAYHDFVESVWRPVAGKAPVVAVPRCDHVDNEVEPLRGVIEGWIAGAHAVKAAALRGSASAVRLEILHLATLVDEEDRWLTELHAGITASIGDAVHAYRRQVSGERFDELDLVFRRLMREFRIPVIDDFYDGVRSLGTMVAGRVRHMLGTSHDHGKAARIERERRRVAELCRGLTVDLARLVDGVPASLRGSSVEWRAAVPQCAERSLVDWFLAAAERDVEQWVADESAAIARTIGTRPGFRRSLVAMKSGLQIGAGVLGGVLMGGLDVSDLAVVPFVERLTAFLLERGLGYPYFRRCRTRLLDVREASLRRFLDGLAAPLHQVIPSPDPDAVERLRAAAAHVPGPQELLR